MDSPGENIGNHNPNGIDIPMSRGMIDHHELVMLNSRFYLLPWGSIAFTVKNIVMASKEHISGWLKRRAHNNLETEKSDEQPADAVSGLT